MDFWKENFTYYSCLMHLVLSNNVMLHVGQGNPKHKYRLGGEWLESSPEEKDLGVLVDEKLNMSRQCVLCRSQPYPGLHQEKHGQQVEGRDSPLYSALVETPPGVLHPALEPPA